MSTNQIPKAVLKPVEKNISIFKRKIIGNRQSLILLTAVLMVCGIALNWEWLVAAGIAPLLIAALPCLLMCGLGLCMNTMSGSNSCNSKQPLEKTTRSPQVKNDSQPE